MQTYSKVSLSLSLPKCTTMIHIFISEYNNLLRNTLKKQPLDSMNYKFTCVMFWFQYKTYFLLIISSSNLTRVLATQT